jgi:hypothetical protein
MSPEGPAEPLIRLYEAVGLAAVLVLAGALRFVAPAAVRLTARGECSVR